MYAYFDKTLGANFTLPSAIWIGLYWVDVTGLGNYTHFWETSGTMKDLTWSKWDAGEPNGAGTENCGRIHTNMYFRTIQCSGNYDILCEGTGSSSCTKGSEEECKLFSMCWWTPARIGLTSGFTSLFVFFCLLCVGWKCWCAPKAQVGYEQDEDDEDEDDGSDNSKRGVHNVMKNHNIDHMPVVSPSQTAGINSVILNKRENSWMSPEELSFSARYSYKH
ncbi:uncharacterized protein LOC123526562 [Mercenaria mercenaria]|uniref:uncharacterized protein LOC123526562 n=1 Tax=Mercenaria mercenaria TaxID=6596 RepID=UPI00234F6B25|nr:uncharacterized protein LOC123526562 [Mercenaria mercenaria]